MAKAENEPHVYGTDLTREEMDKAITFIRAYDKQDRILERREAEDAVDEGRYQARMQERQGKIQAVDEQHNAKARALGELERQLEAARAETAREREALTAVRAEIAQQKAKWLAQLRAA